MSQPVWRARTQLHIAANRPFLLFDTPDGRTDFSNYQRAQIALIKSRLVLDPAPFLQLLLDAGAGPAIRNHVGRTAWDEAMLQVGRSAETYFPPRPVAVKKLDTAMALLRSASEAPH